MESMDDAQPQSNHHRTGVIDMSALSTIKAVLKPTDDADLDRSIAEVKAAQTWTGTVQQRIEKQSSQIRAKETALVEVANTAEVTGDAAPYEKAVAAIAKDKAELARTKLALISAQQRELTAQKTLHAAGLAGHLKTARRITTARLKHANEIAEHVAGLAAAFKSLLTANDRFCASYPFGVAPSGVGLYSPELVTLLELEFLRAHPVDSLSQNRTPLLPGAMKSSHINALTVKSLVDEITASNEFLLQKVAAGK
jgi:hypothetical protein